MAGTPEVHPTHGEGKDLQLEWSWRTSGGRIYEVGNPDVSIYSIDAPVGKSTFEYSDSAAGRVIGRGIMHSFTSINADYEVHGRKGVAQALGKLKMAYTSLSYAYSDDETKPMTMTWESTSGLKRFDVICLDDKQMPVARVHADIWAAKKFAIIEFVGAKANDKAARDEIIVVGLTLLFTMAHRMVSPSKLVGGLFSKTGPIEQKNDDTQA